MAPAPSDKLVKKTAKRGRPKKQEYATPDKDTVDAYGNASLDEV